jgi:hypothetical protein
MEPRIQAGLPTTASVLNFPDRDSRTGSPIADPKSKAPEFALTSLCRRSGCSEAMPSFQYNPLLQVQFRSQSFFLSAPHETVHRRSYREFAEPPSALQCVHHAPLRF